MAKKEVTVKIKGKETVSQASKKAGQGITGLNKTVKDSKSIFKGSAIAMTAAVAAIVGVAMAAKKLVDAYAIQETAETKLRAAIKASGKEASISADALYDYASELQGVTTYGDEATISALAMLQQLGDLNEEGLKKTIPLVQDFAAAMGVDLETAASLVGKTLGSSTNALSRYGLEVDMTGTKEEKLTSLTDAMREKFGGMAKELALTGTGALAQFNNALGDIKEEGGKAILDIMAPMLENLTSHLSLTLQNWKATANLNKALKGEATSIYEVDKALSENDERLDEAQNSTLMLSEKLKEAQAAFDLEAEKIKKGTSAYQTQIGVRADVLSAIRAQVEGNAKEIEQRVENEKLLKKNREEIEKSNVIKSADVIITRAQTEAQKEENEVVNEHLQALLALSDLYDTASFAGMEFVSGMTEGFIQLADKEDEVIDKAQEYKDLIETMAADTIVRYGEAFGTALEEGIAAHALLREAMKETVAIGLESFAQSWAIEAAAALAKGWINPANWLTAAGLAAASVAALAGAGYVRSLAQGGDFIVPPGYENDSYPMRVESGERVTVTPAAQAAQGGGQMIHVTFNLGSRTLYDDFSRATSNGELIIHPRSIKK